MAVRDRLTRVSVHRVVFRACFACVSLRASTLLPFSFSILLRMPVLISHARVLVASAGRRCARRCRKRGAKFPSSRYVEGMHSPHDSGSSLWKIVCAVTLLCSGLAQVFEILESLGLADGSSRVRFHEYDHLSPSTRSCYCSPLSAESWGLPKQCSPGQAACLQRRVIKAFGQGTNAQTPTRADFWSSSRRHNRWMSKVKLRRRPMPSKTLFR